jgi:hypothetical protein
MDNLAPSQKYDFYAHGIAGGFQDIFTPFLGPPSRPANPDPYANRNVNKWNMPENYIGQNIVLRDTVEDLMLTAKSDFWTERILPWFKTDQIHVQWTQWENNPHYMGITPHQAPSRTVTQKRTIRRASIVRRGIAAEFEHDFVRTPLGRTSFMASLAQMARSVQETANVECLRALLNCQRYNMALVRSSGIVPDGDLDAWLDRQRDQFMCVQKDERGLLELNKRIDIEMEQWGGRADVWIIGREVMDYMQLVPPLFTEFDKGGPEAVARLQGRPQNGSARGDTMGNVKSLQPEGFIAGTPTYIAKSMCVDTIRKAELLSEISEIGIYNLMIDRSHDYMTYTSKDRSLRVYDNTLDTWVDLELEDAIRNCVVWQPNGELDNSIFTGRARDVRDMETDFLSHVVGGQRRNITLVGDMDSRWIGAGHFIKAAKSMLVRALNGNRDRIREALNGTTATAVPVAVSDSLATMFGDAITIGFGAAAAYGFGTAAQRDGGGLALESELGSSSRLEKEQEFLSDVVGGVFKPGSSAAAKKDAIANDKNKPWEARATEIKNLIIATQADDPSALTVNKNVKQIDSWFGRISKEFTDELQTAAASAAAVAQNLQSFPIGSKLPAGFKWVDPASARFDARSAYSSMVGRQVDPGARTNSMSTEVPAVDRTARAAYSTAPGSQLSGAIDNIAGHCYKIHQTAEAPIIKALAIYFAHLKVNRDNLLNLCSNNIYVPLGFLLLRPHCTYKTRFAIKMLSDGGTGYTFFGHSDMQIEHEAARKVGLMHYTCYLSSVVFAPKNVFVADKIYCEKYLGGMGTDFWTADYYKKSIKRTVRSIICVPLPPAWQHRNMEPKIDVRGRWYTEMRLKLVEQDRYDKPLYPGAGRISHLLGWSDTKRADKQSNRSNIPFNTVCWQGMEWYWNSVSGKYDDYTVEQGHMGPKVGPGCADVRNGKRMFYADPGYLRVR